MKKGTVYWFTGLSGSGKSTLCSRFVSHMRLNSKYIVQLDGDSLRTVLNPSPAYDAASREKLAFQYAALCKMLSEQGVDVAIATISLFKTVHRWNRENISNYVEIFLDVPFQVLCERDSKGIYSAYSNGKIEDVCGVDLRVDFPASPHICLTGKHIASVENELSFLLKKLKLLGV